MRPKEATDKARTDLDEADRLAAGLIERSAGDRFSPIYMLGAITAVAKSDFPRARGHLVAYRKANPDDKRAEELENLLPPPPVQVAAAERVEGAGVPREKYRPVQPGVSAASGEASAGTICCVVRDKSASNKLYFLSTEHVFSGQPGTAVVQPSPLDGGSAPADVVAHLVKALTPKINVENRVAGAIATIANRTLVNPNCFAVGAFTGVADVSPDDEVTLVGRTSGVAKGRVVAVDSVTSIWTGEGSVTFSGLITCQGTAGGSFSEGGDSGAPVVNARNELVGMLYAGSENVSIVIPIKPILDAFGVELVTE